MQAAFGGLFAEDTPSQQVRLAKAALGALPDSHPFSRNPVLGDHRDSDAGLYDLLLHSRDRPYTVEELISALDQAGLGLASMVETARYDPLSYLPDHEDFQNRVKGLDPSARMALAERLAGNMKTHIAYVAPADRAAKATARPTKPDLVPHLSGVASQALAQQVKARGGFSVTIDGISYRRDIPPSAAALIARIDGQAGLGQIAAGQDWMAFSAAWGPVHKALTGVNLLHYSTGARR